MNICSGGLKPEPNTAIGRRNPLCPVCSGSGRVTVTGVGSDPINSQCPRCNSEHTFKYPLAMIEWVDASRLSDGWMDLSAIPDPYLHTCVTVGFIVSENKDGKILVPTIGDTA